MKKYHRYIKQILVTKNCNYQDVVKRSSSVCLWLYIYTLKQFNFPPTCTVNKNVFVVPSGELKAAEHDEPSEAPLRDKGMVIDAYTEDQFIHLYHPNYEYVNVEINFLKISLFLLSWKNGRQWHYSDATGVEFRFVSLFSYAIYFIYILKQVSLYESIEKLF